PSQESIFLPFQARMPHRGHPTVGLHEEDKYPHMVCLKEQVPVSSSRPSKRIHQCHATTARWSRHSKIWPPESILPLRPVLGPYAGERQAARRGAPLLRVASR